MLWIWWMQHSWWFHLSLITDRILDSHEIKTQLTVNHVFVKTDQMSVNTLYLLFNHIMQLLIDYWYIMMMTVRHWTVLIYAWSDKKTLQYQMTQLQNLTVWQQVHNHMKKETTDWRDYYQTMQMKKCNIWLTELCQTVLQDMLRTVLQLQAWMTVQAGKVKDSLRMNWSIYVYWMTMISFMKNRIIVFTAVTQMTEISAVKKNQQILQTHYSANQSSDILRKMKIWEKIKAELKAEWTVNEIQKKIEAQNFCKCTRRNEMHMQMLQMITQTVLMSLLQHFFIFCLQIRKISVTWNQIKIHLFFKNLTQHWNTDNLHFITLINRFQKLFKQLLMQCWDQQLWICLHLTQTDFCDQFFMLINVILLHLLLQIQFCSHAVFVNFCVVFDVINHDWLNTVLKPCRCSFLIQSLLWLLMTCDL